MLICYVLPIILRFPNNFIGLAGISAGSGQVVSYIGREGNNVKVNVAARYESNAKHFQQKLHH